MKKMAMILVCVVVVSAWLSTTVSAGPVLYYDFEDAYAVDVAPPHGSAVSDSYVGGSTAYSDTVAGSSNPGAGPIWRSDVPVATIAQTGRANTKALDLITDLNYTYESTGFVQLGSGYNATQFNTALGSSGQATMECWLKFNAGSYSNIVVKMGGYALSVGPDKTVQAKILRTNDYDDMVWTTSTKLDDWDWHYVAVEFDFRSGQNDVKVYLDGSDTPDGSITGDNLSYQYTPVAGLFQVGAYKYGDYAYNGMIDELRLTDGILPHDQWLINVPEPATLVVLGLGGLFALKRRRRV